MRALVTDVCVSEFGWELMEWQGHVRKMARDFDKVVISSTDGLLPLYADMNPIFIPHRIKGARDCHRMRPGTITNREEAMRARAEIDATVRKLVGKGFKITKIASIPANKDRAVGERRPIEKQKFIKYGSADGVAEENRFELIIHARNRHEVFPSGGANYPKELWDKVLDGLRNRGISKVAAIGTTDAALLPDGVTDLRGVSLQLTMDLMASARAVVGPSSGPMHLASLCKTPHMVWATNRKQEVINRKNLDRYVSYWNPFKTPNEVILHEKKELTAPQAIVDATMRLLDRVYS